MDQQEPAVATPPTTESLVGKPQPFSDPERQWEASRKGVEARQRKKQERLAQEKAERERKAAQMWAEGIPDDLLDMRHVKLHPKAADVTEGHRACRAWLEDNPSTFIQAKARMEEAWAVRQVQKDGPKRKDMGLEKAREAVERCLRECLAEQAEAKRLKAEAAG